MRGIVSGGAATSYHRLAVGVAVQSPTVHTVFSVYKSDVENQLWRNEKRITANRDWQITGPLFLAIVLTLVTADFHKFAGFSGDAWKGFYLLAAVLSGLHAIYSWNRGRRRPPLSVEELAGHCLTPPV